MIPDFEEREDGLNPKSKERITDMAAEMGPKKFFELLRKEFVFDIEDADKDTQHEIFQVFQEKFNLISKVMGYQPVFERFLLGGLDYLYDNNYQGMEIRIVTGIGKMLREDFTEISFDEQIDTMHDLVRNWQKSKEKQVGNVFRIF